MNNNLQKIYGFIYLLFITGLFSFGLYIHSERFLISATKTFDITIISLLTFLISLTIFFSILKIQNKNKATSFTSFVVILYLFLLITPQNVGAIFFGGLEFILEFTIRVFVLYFLLGLTYIGASIAIGRFLLARSTFSKAFILISIFILGMFSFMYKLPSIINVQSADATSCHSLSEPQDGDGRSRARCYAGTAIENNDIKICNKTTESRERDDCKILFVVKSVGTIEGCDNAFDGENYSMKYSCKIELAKFKNDANICKSLGGFDLTNICYLTFVRKTNDINYCNQMGNTLLEVLEVYMNGQSDENSKNQLIKSNNLQIYSKDQVRREREIEIFKYISECQNIVRTNEVE